MALNTILNYNKNQEMKKISEFFNAKEFPFRLYDSNGNKVYYEDQTGFWSKREYDSNGNEVYCEDSDGEIIDYRQK